MEDSNWIALVLIIASFILLFLFYRLVKKQTEKQALIQSVKDIANYKDDFHDIANIISKGDTEALKEEFKEHKDEIINAVEEVLKEGE